jgi:hypothetical protein
MSTELAQSLDIGALRVLLAAVVLLGAIGTLVLYIWMRILKTPISFLTSLRVAALSCLIIVVLLAAYIESVFLGLPLERATWMLFAFAGVIALIVYSVVRKITHVSKLKAILAVVVVLPVTYLCGVLAISFLPLTLFVGI